jgi:hypothetical protein
MTSLRRFGRQNTRETRCFKTRNKRPLILSWNMRRIFELGTTAAS